MILAAALVALSINKQLDLQSLLTAIARHAAQEEGWYAERRDPQRAFIGAWDLRDRGASARLAGLGSATLLAFVVIRAASFHRVDVLLAHRALGVCVHHMLQMGGIAVIATAAILARTETAAAR